MIGAKEKMIQNLNKRRKVEVAYSSTPEGASSFYKRLAPSSATCSFGLAQEGVQNKKPSIHQTNLTAGQNDKPSERPDKGVQHWQRNRQAHPFRSTHPTQKTEVESVTDNLSLLARSGRPQSNDPHGYQSSNPHEDQSCHYDGYHFSGPNEYQSNNTNGYHTTHHDGHQFIDFLECQAPQGRTDFTNNDAFYRPQQAQSHQLLEHQSHPRIDMMNNGGFHQQQSGYHPQTLQSQHAQYVPRPARKEPQVKPIDKYSPPDYVKIMYHPTPTLEDLGLTSYLDSPPSSPRAVSPARQEAKHTAVPGARESRHTVPTGTVQSKQSVISDTVKYKQTTTLAPWKLIKITLPPVSRVTLAERLAAAPKQTEPMIGQLMDKHANWSKPLSREKHKTAVSNVTVSVVDQSSHEQPRDFMEQHQANIVKDRGAICVSPSGVSSSAAIQKSRDGQSSAPAVEIAAKRKALESCSGETDRPKKKMCVWATAAEQYITDSHKSENQEANRDAAYRRYNSGGRPCMRQQVNDATRHQSNDFHHQPHRIESYDQMLAHEKARHNVGQSQDKLVPHLIRWHGNVAPSTMDTKSYSKGQQTADSSVSLDIFRRMSPFSCWSQTTPGDPRFS